MLIYIRRAVDLNSIATMKSRVMLDVLSRDSWMVGDRLWVHPVCSSGVFRAGFVTGTGLPTTKVFVVEVTVEFGVKDPCARIEYLYQKLRELLMIGDGEDLRNDDAVLYIESRGYSRYGERAGHSVPYKMKLVNVSSNQASNGEFGIPSQRAKNNVPGNHHSVNLKGLK
ncbi:hypothetical protein PM082_004488 [Marasmius tenuissimus]|nr:hypothetical protein PM082_004488 [Marasmius tenuissimus]